MSVNLSNIAILNIKGYNYCCIISLISKIEAINLMQNLMQNADLTKKSRTLLSMKILTFGDVEIEKNKFYHHKNPNFFGRCRY